MLPAIDYDKIAAAGQVVIDGLNASAHRSIVRWAPKNRIMGPPYPGPYNFRYFPWVPEMLQSKAEENVGQKAAQQGYSDAMLLLSLHTVIVQQGNVLYILPARVPDAQEFSTGRFEPALDLSPSLAAAFSERNSVMFKRAGNACLFIRGSRSPIKSIPAQLVILDETDEMSKRAYALARERLSGQIEGTRRLWAVSTPTIPNFGINAQFRRSTQQYFFFRCPACSRHIRLTEADNFVICGTHEHDPDVARSHYKCNECSAKLPEAVEAKADMLSKGSFVAAHPDRVAAGWHVSQMYSMAIRPIHLAQSYFRGKLSVEEETEYKNSKMGEVFVPEGGQVGDEHIEACIQDYKMNAPGLMKPIITIGVDVGKKLNVEVTHYVPRNDIQSVDINVKHLGFLLFAGEVSDFSDLHDLMHLYNPFHTVIDYGPETRAALNFAAGYPGRVTLCRYAELSGRELVQPADCSYVSASRTPWLDMSIKRFFNRTIALPTDRPRLYDAHIKALVRHYTLNKRTGEMVARYSETGPDHYAHARNYSEIALRVGYMVSRGELKPLTERVV